MPAGRPTKSEVRQNIINILYLENPLCGYDIYKIYLQIYGKVSMRLVYYHLKKGIQTHEMDIAEIRKTRGNYSWGSEAEKIYYCIGKTGNPKLTPEIISKFSNLNLNKK